MWHAGLRGGFALVLTLEMGDWANESDPLTKVKLRNATVILICVFLLLFGGSTQFFLETLKIPTGTKAKPMKYPEGYLWKLLMWIHDEYAMPLLVGNQVEDKYFKG